MSKDVKIRRYLLGLSVVIYLLFSLVTGTFIASDWSPIIGVLFIILELICFGLTIGHYYECYGEEEPFI